MLFSVEQEFVGRDEKRAFLKTSTWEAIINGSIATKKWYQVRLSSKCLNALFLPSKRGVVYLFVSTLNGFQLRHNFEIGSELKID